MNREVAVAWTFAKAAARGDPKFVNALCAPRRDDAIPRTRENDPVMNVSTGAELREDWAAARFVVDRVVHRRPTMYGNPYGSGPHVWV